MGDLEGIFVAEKADVQNLIESKIQVYFGEVLGKHSEIYGAIDAGDLTMTNDNPEAVALFETSDLASGFDPFVYTVIRTEEVGLDPIEDETTLEAVHRWVEMKGK